MNQKALRTAVGKRVLIPFNDSALEGVLVRVFEKWILLEDCEQDGVRAKGSFLVQTPEWVQVID